MQRFATPGDLYPSPDLLFTSSVCIDSTTVREIPRARRSCPRLILMWGWPCWGRILRSWSYRLVPVDLETRGRASLHSNTNKKLGYRRETARQLHTAHIFLDSLTDRAPRPQNHEKRPFPLKALSPLQQCRSSAW